MYIRIYDLVRVASIRHKFRDEWWIGRINLWGINQWKEGASGRTCEEKGRKSRAWASPSVTCEPKHGEGEGGRRPCVQINGRAIKTPCHKLRWPPHLFAQSLTHDCAMIDKTHYRAEKKSWYMVARELSSCSCLTLLPGPAWVLLSKICQDFFSAL